MQQFLQVVAITSLHCLHITATTIQSQDKLHRGKHYASNDHNSTWHAHLGNTLLSIYGILFN